jgi:crotonobetainyl-CoA:carnitine CoA-transferase CaiB-like acyl-CoA transferase
MKTGEGQRVEVSLLDGQVYMLTYIAQYFFRSGKVPGPIGAGHQTLVPYQSFKTKDIQIVIVAHQNHHFKLLCQAIGKPEWAEDPRFSTRMARLENKAVLIPLMESHLQTKKGDEWLEAIHKVGVPAGPINTLDRVLSDPQVLAREMVVETEGPGGPGMERIKTIGNPLKMEKTPVNVFARPPMLGEHTREVLMNLLGYSKEKIEGLKEKGVIKLAE